MERAADLRRVESWLDCCCATAAAAACWMRGILRISSFATHAAIPHLLFLYLNASPYQSQPASMSQLLSLVVAFLLCCKEDMQMQCFEIVLNVGVTEGTLLSGRARQILLLHSNTHFPLDHSLFVL